MPVFDVAGRRIYVSGHNGMVGSALVRRLRQEDCEIITAGRSRLDLRRQVEVEDFLKEIKPDCVVIAAAKVGGIVANDSYPADFIYDNLAIQTNLIHASHLFGVQRLLFLGSSCIYPKFAPQPMREDALLTGPLEPTNQWYAIAKIAGIKQCDAYRRQYGRSYVSVMPTNLYGPGDNYHPENSHVIPALVRKLHEAKVSNSPEVVIWGTGRPTREFLHVDDLADALVFILKNYDEEGQINAGSGQEISIRELAETLAEVIGFKGKFVFDHSKPDGTPRKLMDSSRLASMGWKPKIPLQEGFAAAYQWFLENKEHLRH